MMILPRHDDSRSRVGVGGSGFILSEFPALVTYLLATLLSLFRSREMCIPTLQVIELMASFEYENYLPWNLDLFNYMLLCLFSCLRL